MLKCCIWIKIIISIVRIVCWEVTVVKCFSISPPPPCSLPSGKYHHHCLAPTGAPNLYHAPLLVRSSFSNWALAVESSNMGVLPYEALRHREWIDNARNTNTQISFQKQNINKPIKSKSKHLKGCFKLCVCVCHIFVSAAIRHSRRPS